MTNRKNFFLFGAIVALGIIVISLGYFVFSLKKTPISQPQPTFPSSITTKSSNPSVPFTFFIDDVGKPVSPGFTIQYAGNKTFSLVGILDDIYVENTNLYATVSIKKAGLNVPLHFLMLSPNTYLFLYTTHVTNVFGRQEKMQPVKLLKGDLSSIAKLLTMHKNQEIIVYISLFTLPPELAAKQNSITQGVVKAIKDHLDCNTSLFQSLTANSNIDPSCTYYSNYLTVYGTI